jgi:membrane protease YdiL (CAAX protease family)
VKTAPRHPRLAPFAGLVLALGIPSATAVLAPGAEPPSVSALSQVPMILVNEAFMWTLTLAVLAIVLFWERRPLSSIGLVRPTSAAIQVGCALTVGLLILALAAGAVFEALGFSMGNDEQVATIVAMPVWLQLFAAISAGFTEEILFRGYSIERLGELTGRRWVGAALTIVIFGAIHAPFWGVGHALVAGLSGLWLSLIYLWRRNLWTNITAHALLDILAFLSTDIALQHGATTG